LQEGPLTSSTELAKRNDEEVARARDVQSADVTEFLKGQGIHGVAITSRADNPGEAALLGFGKILIPEPCPVLIPFALSECRLAEICISIPVRVKSAPL
jgi:hypothetical protein